MDTGNIRSSILKPQKSRNPLSDLDLVEPVKVDSPVTTTTTRRSSLRRVSFASSNFVKEFATDPEKNTTLWDTTYEERLNHSDPSSSSSEIARNPVVARFEKQSVLSMQPDSETTTNLESLNQPCVTTCSEAADKIRLIKPVVCTQKSNRKTSINFYEEGGEDIISDSSLCGIDNCENRIILTRNIQASTDIKNVNVVNSAIHTMAVAQQYMQKERHTANTEVNVEGIYDVKTYLPQVSPSNTENMHFTNLVDQFQNSSSIDKENIPILGAANIEFAPKLQSFHKNECGIKNRTIVADENMEFTQQMPIVGKDSYNPRNKTIMMDNSIEFTQPLPAFNFLPLHVNNIDELSVNKDGENRTIIIDENMETTQQFPVDKNGCNPRNTTVVMDESMEYTRALSAGNFLPLNVMGINESPVKDDQNRTVVTDENMDVTQQLPVDKSSCNPRNKTIMVDLEFTQQVSGFNFLLPNVNNISKNVKGDNFNKKYDVISAIKTTGSSQQLHNPNMESNTVSNMPTINNDDIKMIGTESVVASPTAVSGKNVELPQSLAEGVCTENKVLQNFQASEKLSENNVGPNKSTTANADKLIHVNHSFYVSRCAENENKENAIDIMCTASMDVDDIIVAKSPVVIDQNREDVNNLSAVVNKTPISRLQCVNEKSTASSSVVVLTSMDMDKVLTELPLGTAKNKVVTDAFENKNEKSLLQLEGEYGPHTSCSSTDLIKSTNQKLMMNHQNIHVPNTSSALGDSKNMNVSNGAFQQFHIVNNTLPTLCPTENQNLELLPDVEKLNTIKLVDENVNKTESQMNIQNEEIKEASKEMAISRQDINCSGLKTPGSSFHMTFTPCSPGIDDTQHLINYSLTHKQPKSDFSKFITGDLNPSFLCSKFMPLGEFSSDAFPVSLETTRNNQTHMELDKIKDWDVFPGAAAAGCSNGNQFEREQLDKDKNSALSVLAETADANKINVESIKHVTDRNCVVFPSSLETVRTHLEQVELHSDENDEKRIKDKPPLLLIHNDDEANSEVRNRENVSKLKRRSLENIHNVICKKPMLDDIEKNDEDLTLSDSVASANDTFTTEAKELILNITQSMNAHSSINKNTYQLQKSLQETETNRTLLKQRFADFIVKMKSCAAAINKNSIILAELHNEESKEITRPFKQRSFEEIKGNTDSSLECSLVEPTMDNMVVEERSHFHIDSDLNINIEKVLTVKEKIEEKRKRCKTYWNVLSIEDNKCEFVTLYKTIRIIVHLNMETGIVNKTDICCKISDESEPIALFVHKIFKDRLSQNNIQSAVGERYDVLTLLDYVYMNMQNMLDVMKEFDGFDKQYNMKMDRNFRVTFKMVNFHLRNTWSISVDMSDLENINEDSITTYAKVGTVNETEIKRFAVGCSRGTLFLRSFIKNILGYVELLMKRKTLTKCKAIS